MLLHLDGYAPFNQIIEYLSWNGPTRIIQLLQIPLDLSSVGVFSMFAQSVTGKKLQFCDKVTYGLLHDQEDGIFFFKHKKKKKAEQGALQGFNREKMTNFILLNLTISYGL